MGEHAFRAVNRNKRSITLDLKDPGDVATLHRLVATADVLTENFRPGVAARLGADYETLRALNPRLIYASISGFGQTGPYAQRPGFDLIAQGAAGVMSVTGEPGGNPVKCRRAGQRSLGRPVLRDRHPLARCTPRERTGEGQRIDTSLWEGALALSIWETAELWETGNAPQPLGSAHRLTAPYQALRTQDGHLTVGGNNQKLWLRLCAVIGREDLPDDPRFADQRRPHGQPPRAGRRARVGADRARPPRTGSTRCSRRASPRARSSTTRRSSTTPTRRAREMVVEMEHPEAGTVSRRSASPSSSAPRRARSAAPPRCWASTPTRSWPSSRDG